MYKEVARIIKGVADQLSSNSIGVGSSCMVDPFGGFTLRQCDSSWTDLLMLGATDYYQKAHVSGLQIFPDESHTTIDVPDMSVPWSPGSAPVWQWMKEAWTYSVPRSSHAITDLNALRGSRITEACRWEEDYWELFAGAGPDIPKEQTRIVGLGTLLATDPSLAAVLELKIGSGIWREDDSEWRVWEASNEADES